MALPKEVFVKMKELFGNTLDCYDKEIEKGYHMADGKFSIGFRVTIEPDVAGHKVDCNINFVKEKIKDVYSDVVESNIEEVEREI